MVAAAPLEAARLLRAAGLLDGRKDTLMDDISRICCERSAEPRDQRRRLIAAIKAGGDLQATDKNGVTALHHAVRFRSPAAVKTLIEHGADVNCACRRNGSTPLHRAVTQTGAPGTAGRGREAAEIVRLLLAAGADATIRNKAGKTPADYCSDETLRKFLGTRTSAG